MLAELMASPHAPLWQCSLVPLLPACLRAGEHHARCPSPLHVPSPPPPALRTAAPPPPHSHTATNVQHTHTCPTWHPDVLHADEGPFGALRGSSRELVPVGDADATLAVSASRALAICVQLLPISRCCAREIAASNRTLHIVLRCTGLAATCSTPPCECAGHSGPYSVCWLCCCNWDTLLVMLRLGLSSVWLRLG